MSGRRQKITRTIVLVGLMGSGKSSIGRRLAERLGLSFVDADAEIEAAAGCSIEDFFERYGEEEFRRGERRVMKRLLDAPVHVLSTGGGAFIDEENRETIRQRGIPVWLRADITTLLDRVTRRNDRPLQMKELLQVCQAVAAEGGLVQEIAEMIATRSLDEGVVGDLPPAA